MTLYAEIVNDLTEAGVGFRMTQSGSVEDSILRNLVLVGVAWEAQSEGTCRVYYREMRRTIRSGDVSMQCE